MAKYAVLFVFWSSLAHGAPPQTVTLQPIASPDLNKQLAPDSIISGPTLVGAKKPLCDQAPEPADWQKLKSPQTARDLLTDVGVNHEDVDNFDHLVRCGTIEALAEAIPNDPKKCHRRGIIIRRRICKPGTNPILVLAEHHDLDVSEPAAKLLARILESR